MKRTVLAASLLVLSCSSGESDGRIYEAPNGATSANNDAVDTDLCSRGFRFEDREGPVRTSPLGVAQSSSTTFLLVDPYDEGGLVLRSYDNGTSWEPLDIGSERGLSIIANDDMVVVSATDAMWRSTDDGQTWESEPIEGSFRYFDGVLANGEFASVDLNAGTVEASADGFSWRDISPNIGEFSSIAYASVLDGNIAVIEVDSSTPPQSRAHVSTDSGQTWQTYEPPSSPRLYAVANTPAGPLHIYSPASDPEQLFESSDGQGWAPATTLDGVAIYAENFSRAGDEIWSHSYLGIASRRGADGVWSNVPFGTYMIGAIDSPTPRIVAGTNSVHVLELDGAPVSEFAVQGSVSLDLETAQITPSGIVSTWAAPSQLLSSVVLMDGNCNHMELGTPGGHATVVADRLAVDSSTHDVLDTEFFALLPEATELTLVDIPLESVVTLVETEDAWMLLGSVDDAFRVSRSDDGLEWTSAAPLQKSASSAEFEAPLPDTIGPSFLGRTDDGYFATEDGKRIYTSVDSETWNHVEVPAELAADGTTFTEVAYGQGEWLLVTRSRDEPWSLRVGNGEGWETVEPPVPAETARVFSSNGRLYLLLIGEPDGGGAGTLLTLAVFDQEGRNWQIVDRAAYGMPPLDTGDPYGLRKLDGRLTIYAL